MSHFVYEQFSTVFAIRNNDAVYEHTIFFLGVLRQQHTYSDKTAVPLPCQAPWLLRSGRQAKTLATEPVQ